MLVQLVKLLSFDAVAVITIVKLPFSYNVVSFLLILLNSVRMRQVDSDFCLKMNHIIEKLQHISWPLIDGDALDTSTEGLDSTNQSALLIQVYIMVPQ